MGTLWFGRKSIRVSGFLAADFDTENEPITIEVLTKNGKTSKQAILFVSVQEAQQLRDELDAAIMRRTTS